MGQFSDYDLLRFCKSQKFDLLKTKVMFQNFIGWRKENNVDDILNTFNFPEEA